MRHAIFKDSCNLQYKENRVAKESSPCTVTGHPNPLHWRSYQDKNSRFVVTTAEPRDTLSLSVYCHAAGGPHHKWSTTMLQVVWLDHVKLLQMVHPSATGPPNEISTINFPVRTSSMSCFAHGSLCNVLWDLGGTCPFFWPF